ARALDGASVLRPWVRWRSAGRCGAPQPRSRRVFRCLLLHGSVRSITLARTVQPASNRALRAVMPVTGFETFSVSLKRAVYGSCAPPCAPEIDGRDLSADIFTSVKVSPRETAVIPLDRCEVECVDPDRVRTVLERLPDATVFQDLAETFRVLSDPGRV